jgi:UPF0271 protein
MKIVLDSSFFFYDLPVEGELYTTPSVVDELVDIRSKGKYEKYCALGLRVLSPGSGDLVRVDEAARKTGDAGVISATDRDLLALTHALGPGAILYTDDFAIQNVAGKLGMEISPMQQRKAKRIRWKYRCSGCRKFYDHDGECPVCGAEIKRKLK